MAKILRRFDGKPFLLVGVKKLKKDAAKQAKEIRTANKSTKVRIVPFQDGYRVYKHSPVKRK